MPALTKQQLKMQTGERYRTCDKKNTTVDSLSEFLLQNLGRGLAYSLDKQTRHKETTPPKSGSVDHSPDPKGVLFSREALQSVLTAAELLALGLEDGNQCRSGQSGEMSSSVCQGCGWHTLEGKLSTHRPWSLIHPMIVNYTQS